MEVWLELKSAAHRQVLAQLIEESGHAVATCCSGVALVDADAAPLAGCYSIAVALEGPADVEAVVAGGFDDVITSLAPADLRRALALAGRQRSQSLEAAHAVTAAAHAPDMLFLLNRDLVVEWASGACREALGCDPAELSGAQALSFVHPDDIHDAMVQMHLVLTGGPAHDIEVRLRKSDGGWLEAEMSGRVIRDGRGEATGFVLVARTIERRAAVVRSLRESEARLLTVVETSPDLISILDSDGRFVFANGTHARLLGKEPTDLLGTEGLALVHPDDQEAVLERIGQLMEGGGPDLAPARLQHASGDWIPFELGAGRIGDPENAEGLVIVSRDRRERLAAEAQAAALEERFKQAFHRSPSGMFLLSIPSRQLLDVNEEFERITGFSREMALGCSMEELGLLEQIDDREQLFTRLWLEGRLRDREIVITTRGGEARTLRASFERFDLNGDVVVLGNLQDITEQRRAEDEARKLATILAVQQEATRDAILVVDRNQRAIFHNSHFREIWGLSSVEVEAGLERRTAAVVAQLAHPEETLAWLERLYDNELAVESGEVELVGERFLDMYTAPLLAADGTNYGRAWYYRDVTERKRAEDDLRESEERYRRLVELSPLAIAVHRKGLLLYGNPTAAEMMGVSPADLRGRHVEDLIHPEDRAKVGGTSGRDSEGAFGAFVQVRLLTGDGRTIYVELSSGRTLFDRLPATQTVIRDVTDRVLAERAMQESEARYRAVVEQSPDAIVVHDGTRVLFANAAAARLVGVESGEVMVGKPWTDYLEPPPPDVLRERGERVDRGEVFSVTEFRRLPASDQRIEVEITYCPTAFGGTRALQLVIRDITERRRAEEERLALERKLLETQKLESLGVMAGGIAHDFNNLLVAIMGNAGLAMMELPDDSPATDYIRDIELASQRAAELARQMLAYSGKGRFIVTWTDIGELVEEMGNLLAASLPNKVRIQYEFTPGLPRVQCDATQIRQVVMNLVINGSEAIGDREGLIRVRTGATEVLPGSPDSEDLEPGRYLVLDVMDTGSGMDEATRRRIFEPFFTTKFTGRGLGLAAVLGIAKGHGGAIRVESVPGKGTTFRLLLPVKTEPAAAALAPAPPAEAPVHRGAALLIDSDASVQHVGRAMLERLGYTVQVAADAHAGLVALANAASEIVVALVDASLPARASGSLLERIRAEHPGIHVLVISDRSQVEVAEMLGEAAVAAFLQKPFTFAELRAALE